MQRADIARWALVVIGLSAVLVAFFAPVLFSSRYLGDAVDQLIESLPAYLGQRPLWEPRTMLGYPLASNPIDAHWYPLGLMRFVPNSYNAYEILAYVLAAIGTYGLVRSATRSTVAGVTGGLVFALGGFMIGQAGHADIIHPAAWMPYVVWALSELRRSARGRWIALGAIALALTALAGQPQIFVYTLALSAACLLAFAGEAQTGRRPYLTATTLTLALGLALCAVVVVPAVELGAQSVRAGLTFDQFQEFAIPVLQVPIRLFFPYMLGETTMQPYGFSAINVGSFAEMSNYAGLTTLVLAVVGVSAYRRQRDVRFWLIVALAAIALSTGNQLGLAWLTYHLPVYNLFRAPGRLASVVNLAAAVLAGFGIAAIETGLAQTRTVTRSAFRVAAAMFATFLFLLVFSKLPMQATILTLGGSIDLHVNPLQNAALGVPIVLFVTVVLVLRIWSLRPRAVWAQLLLVVAVLGDLSSFAWFSYWNYGAFPPSRLAPPPYAGLLRSQLEPLQQRVLTIPIGQRLDAGISPNLNLLWGISSARGYTPLQLARTATLIDSTWMSPPQILNAHDRSLDVAAIRYLIVPEAVDTERPLVSGPWDPDQDLEVRIGGIASEALPVLELSFPAPIVATRIALRGKIDSNGAGDSRNGGVVLTATDDDDRVQRLHIAAAAQVAAGGFARLARSTRIRTLSIRWADDRSSVLVLDQLSFIDDARGIARPLTASGLLTYGNSRGNSRWRRVGWPAADSIFENAAALPRAWPVHRVLETTADRALGALRDGRLDPRKVGLAEGAPALDDEPRKGAPEVATIDELAAERMRLTVRCRTTCFLVTSDTTYPGWHASVDGAETPIYPTDYALRGVFVPAGRHEVLFFYRPRSLQVGAALTLAGLAATLAVVVLPFRFRSPRLRPH